MAEDNARVFATLKQAYRARGLTYRDVGRRVGLSESAIKKIFSNEDCSLGRLGELAEVAELPLSELFKLAARPAFERVELSDAQQRGLLEDPAAFALYWKLVAERMSVSEIKRSFHLSERRCWQLLSRLDDLGLVVLGPEGRVTLVHRGLVRWVGEGPLLSHLHATWPIDALTNAQREPPGALYRLHELHLRPETADELRHRLTELLDDFLRRARYEQNTTARRDRDALRLALAVAPGGFVPTIP